MAKHSRNPIGSPSMDPFHSFLILILESGNNILEIWQSRDVR